MGYLKNPSQIVATKYFATRQVFGLRNLLQPVRLLAYVFVYFSGPWCFFAFFFL